MKRFRNILFVTEPDIDNATALDQAIRLAEHHQAHLTVAGTVDLGHTALPQTLLDGLIAERDAHLTELVRNRSLTNGAISTTILSGKPFIEVIRAVLRNDCDLVIKPHETGGSGFSGGTDTKLLRKCPCPLWIINATEHRRDRQIVVALDYEPENSENEALNRQLMDMAASLALSEFAELHIVHAWHLEHEGFLRSPRSGLTESEVDQMLEHERNRRQRWLSGIVSDCRRRFGDDESGYLKPQFHLIEGHAQEIIPRCVRYLDAELLVMGTLGRTGVQGLLIGNTAEKILDSIGCSVLTMKPPAFVSPVTVP